MDRVVELRVGELFAGAGGLSLGFILAEHPLLRFRPVFAIDNDAYALKSYSYNMEWLLQNAPEVLPQIPGIFKRNVENLNVPAILRLLKLRRGELDLLIGGPPCQGFSTSNRRGKEKSKADRNKLVKVFLDKLDEFRPKMFLIENVQGVRWTPPTSDMQATSAQASLFLDTNSEPRNVQEFLMQKASSLGYCLWSDVLDAVDFGVPQSRKRFFLLGVHADFVATGEKVKLAPYLKASAERISVLQAIGDLPRLENGQSWDCNEYHPGADTYIKKMRCFMANGDLYDHTTTCHADYVIERYRRIPEGGNWRDVQDDMSNYKKIENTHSNIYRRLVSNEPANTISHYRKSMIIHPSQDRGLSFREACRLQSFPDWCRFQGTVNDKQQQLANAVPPLMAAAVARAIAEFWLHNISLEPSTTISSSNYA